MTQNAVEINGQNLPVREYEGVRVVIGQDVAKVHQVQPESINKLFYRHKKHFVENVDYFKLRGKKMVETICPDASKTTTDVNVYSESGYLMLAKSLTDDLSWQVQRMLVNNYFKVKQVERVHEVDNSLERLVQIFPLLEDVYKQIIYYRAEKGLTQYETSKVLGLTRKAIYNREKELREAGVMLPRQNNAGNKYNLTVLKALAEVK